MRNQASVKKCRKSSLRQIDKLIREDYVARLHGFLHAAHCAHGNNSSNPDRLQGINVGPVIDFGGIISVADAMPRQERNPNSVKLAEHDGTRRRSEWCSHVYAFDLMQPFHVV